MMQKFKNFPKSWTTMIKWRNIQKKIPREGHDARVVLPEFYSDLKEVKQDEPDLQLAVKVEKKKQKNSW